MRIPSTLGGLPVRQIGGGNANDAAFMWKKAESVEIPEGVERIAYGAFVECKNLVSVSLPDSLR